MTLKGLVATVLTIGVGFGVASAYRIVHPAAPEPAGVVAAASPAPGSSSVSSRTSSALPSAARIQQSQRDPVAPHQAQPKPVELAGRVLDLEGAPVAGARVFVGGQPSRFERVEAGLFLAWGRGEHRHPAKGEPGEDYCEEEIGSGLAEWAAVDAERLKRNGAVLGKAVLTDAEGRFAVSLPAGSRTYVTFLPRLGLHKTANGGWHDLPAEGIELRAQRVPTAELAIHVVDLTTGKKLPFAGELHAGEHALAEWKAEGEVVRRTVELPPGAASLFRVDVVAPVWARTSREFSVQPGRETEIELQVQSGTGLTGQVVDARGVPIEGAVVCWGDELDLRQQRSLFRTYQPRSVPGATCTDATGRFTLPGTAARVSAWHPAHSPASVAAADAARLVLPARGAIRGVVLDARGLPSAGTKLILDRARETATDAQGVYLFENVEAGVHGVGWSERHVGVVVAPGETMEIAPEEPIEPRVELTSGGVPFATRRVGGVILGLGRVFSVSEWVSHEGRLDAGSVRGGRHLLMSRAGVLTILDVRPEATTIELGTARVTIETEREDPVVYLLPEEASAHPAARFFGRRAFEEREGGRVAYGPLPAGRYVIVVEGRDVDLQIDVAQGEDLVIPRERWMGGF